MLIVDLCMKGSKERHICTKSNPCISSAHTKLSTDQSS